MLTASGSVWGANTACPTAAATTYNSSGINVIATTGITVAGDATTSGPGIATVNTLTGLNALGGGGGCIATDITFNNLTATSGTFVSNAGTTSTGGVMSAGGTYVYHEVARDILMFTTTRDCNSVACGADDILNQTVQYQTGSVTGNILFEVNSAQAFTNGAVTLFLTNYLRTTTGVFSYSLLGCRDTGAGLTITGAPFANCASVGGTAITPISGSFAALTVGSGTAPVSIASGTITTGSHFYFNLSFTMNGAGTGGGTTTNNIDSYFHGIGVQFIETPEPSSWMLLSGGLAALAWLRRKKRTGMTA
jgi:hypothetical protein